MNKTLHTLTFLCFFILNTANSQTISISGKVVRHNGEPVEGALITCTNTLPVISAPDGSFIFTDLPEGEDYEINGTHETDVLEGITVLDVLFGRYMIIVPGFDFNDFQWYAADLNNSFSFSTIDLVLMLKAALKLDTLLLDPYWYFFNQSGTQQNGIVLENVVQDTSGLELIATKSGDVAIDSDHFPPPPDAPQPLYFVYDMSSGQDEEVTIEIRVNDFKNIGGFQQGLSWDPVVLEYIGIEDSIYLSTWINEDYLDEGHFLVANLRVDDVSNFELEDGTVLYSLKFKVLQNFTSLAGVIDIAETMIPMQTVYRPDAPELFLLDDSFEIVENTSINGTLSLEKFDVAPNPAFDEFSVKIYFKSIEKAELSLLDVCGRLIQSWEISAHEFEESISVRNLSKGTYVLKLLTTKGIVTKKIIKF